MPPYPRPLPASRPRVPAPEPFTRSEGLFLGLVAAVFIASVWRYLGLDFWYDEVFTLTNYVFVPLGRTVTDYSFPNNHVLYSLANNLGLRLAGIGTLFRLMDLPWVARLLPLACSAGTAGLLYAAARREFDRFTAQASVAVLTTTIPFLNVACQVRGFSLSMLLLTALLWCYWRFERRPAPGRAAAVAALVALALYTIPLSLYFIICLAALPLARLVRRPRGRDLHDRERQSRAARLLLSLAAGAALAALLYAPVLGEVTGNRFVRSQGLFNATTLLGTMPRVLGHFMAPRYLLWAVVAGAPVAWVLARQRSPAFTGGRLLQLVLLLLGPFFLSFVRGDQPWQRVFVNLAPVFALLVAACLHVLLDAIPRLRRFAFPVLLGLLVYCAAMSRVGTNTVRGRLLQDIETGNRSQDVYYNYYLAYYHPNRLLARFARDRDPLIPVVLHDVDWAALPAYADKHGVAVLGPDALDGVLQQHGRAYVVAAGAPRFLALVRQRYPGFTARSLYPEPDFHSIFLVSRAPR